MTVRNIIFGIIAIVVIAIVGGIAYLQIAGGSGEASQDIQEVAGSIENAGDATVMRIVPEDSQASFTLEEDLRGTRTTVVGTTNQVGGELAINFDDPQSSSVSTITINARTLQTDQSFRNQALRSNILRSARDEYEFITFEPTSLSGLPDNISVGETYTFDITGDLTIIETTNPVTFTVEVTVVSETEISGTASTNITYGDWGIPVPTAPVVANVTPDVDLAIEFVARTSE